jgi:hypothetical protein
MSENANNLSCAAFQAELPELIASEENIAGNPHYQSCENCRALLADLETIAAEVRRLFPEVEPPHDLWVPIELAMKDEEARSGSR